MILYKYLKKKHADSLISRGEVYIQTLNNLLAIEEDALRDENEGKLTSIMNGHTIDPTKPETVTPQIGRVLRGGRIKLEGTLTIGDKFNETTDNCFVYSTSLIRSKELMLKLDKEACVLIKDHKQFVQRLNKCMIKRFQEVDYPIAKKVEYIKKVNLHTLQTGTEPIFTKEMEFKSEFEFRLVWPTTLSLIKPEPIQCNQIVKLVELVNL